MDELNDLMKKFSSELELKINGLKLTNELKYGLTNLDKLTEEAIFDAINFFDKKCPYCDIGLYEDNIRKKIEYDHFYPIAKGGQHFPWNLLPICKNCNRKKKDKMPYDFLNKKKFETCSNYLNEVKNRISSDHEDKLSKYEMLYSYIDRFSKSKISKDDLVFNILNICRVEILEEVNSEKNTLILRGDQKNNEILKSFMDIILPYQIYFINVEPKSEIIKFSLSAAYKIYLKRKDPKKELYPKGMIRNIFKTNPAYIKNSTKTVRIQFHGTTPMFSLDYKLMNQDWQQIFKPFILID